jgi:hypothetical protein
VTIRAVLFVWILYYSFNNLISFSYISSKFDVAVRDVPDIWLRRISDSILKYPATSGIKIRQHFRILKTADSSLCTQIRWDEFSILPSVFVAGRHFIYSWSTFSLLMLKFVHYYCNCIIVTYNLLPFYLPKTLIRGPAPESGKQRPESGKFDIRYIPSCCVLLFFYFGT